MINLKQKQQEAAEFLGKKGRRIEIIFFGLLLVFVTVLPIYLFLYLDYFISIIVEKALAPQALEGSLKNAAELVAPIISGLAAIIFVIFLTCPVYACFFRHSYKIYREGIAGKSKYFDLGPHGYFGSLKSGAAAFGIFALCLAPVVIFVEVGMKLAASSNEKLVNVINYTFVCIIALGLVLGFLIFLLFKPFFLFGYYTARGKSARDALKESKIRMRSPRAKKIYMAYIKAFIPSLLLSVVMVLVFFLLDTLPKMSIVYFDIADEIIYGEQQ